MDISELTLKNIRSFFEGYARHYLDKISLLPKHTREQVFYRIYICKDSCLVLKKCERCNCQAIKKSYATASCNLDKFPNLMPKVEWEEYKLSNNIDESVISTILKEVETIFNK